MKAVLWRLDGDQAVVYTEDREVVRRLTELPAFPARSEAAFTTYENERGKVFGWQTVFAVSLWPRVTRHLRAGEVALEDRSPAATAPPRPASASAIPASKVSPVRPAPVKAPPGRTRAAARTPAAPTRRPAARPPAGAGRPTAKSVPTAGVPAKRPAKTADARTAAAQQPAKPPREPKAKTPAGGAPVKKVVQPTRPAVAQGVATGKAAPKASTGERLKKVSSEGKPRKGNARQGR